MKKFYYENVLNNENFVAKPNLVWSADITNFELSEGKKVFIYFFIDIYTNKTVTTVFRNRIIKTADIVPKLNEAIRQRIPIKPKSKLIIHTDRGTQFTSASYNKFIEQNKDFIQASMSRANAPKNNAVVERFIRTFKEHKINNKTFQEELFDQIEDNAQFKGYRKVFNFYIKDINFKPNKKSKTKSPEHLEV